MSLNKKVDKAIRELQAAGAMDDPDARYAALESGSTIGGGPGGLDAAAAMDGPASPPANASDSGGGNGQKAATRSKISLKPNPVLPSPAADVAVASLSGSGSSPGLTNRSSVALQPTSGSSGSGGGSGGRGSELEPQRVRQRVTVEDIMQEQEEAADIRHYLNQVGLIVQPVMICIMLVVWWVKVDQSGGAVSVSSLR